MWATLNNRQTSNRIFIVLMTVLIALAWLALWLSDRSGHGDRHGEGYGFLHSLHSLDAFAGGANFALVFIGGWTVMIVAMMLPTSLPLIALFRSVARQRRDRDLLTALLVAGYLVTWALFGVLVYSGGWLLQEAAGRSVWLEANAWILNVGVLGLAGAYQFTPLKYHCLEKCRSPLSFVTEHWSGSRERSQSFRLGLHHGVFCVGCCWSLMLLMFLVGAAGALLWMLVLGAVMALEKNVYWGRRISVPLGVLLIGAALALGAGPALQSAAPSDTATARVLLSPSHGSDVSGTAIFIDAPGGVEVRLEMQGLPESGTTYLAHIHPGSCAENPSSSVSRHDHYADGHGHAAPIAEITHPLTPLVPESGRTGGSTTLIDDLTIAQLFSGDTNYHVNVHAQTTGDPETPTLACGNLTDDEKSAHNLEEEHHDH